MAVRSIELTSRERRAPPNHRAHSSSCIPHLNTILTNTTAARLQACAHGSLLWGQAVQHPLQTITHQNDQQCQGTQPRPHCCQQDMPEPGKDVHPSHLSTLQDHMHENALRAAGKRQNAAGQGAIWEVGDP